MSRFYCKKCRKSFEFKGVKREWVDPIYGSCSKYVANCPDCGIECNEFRQKSSSKKKFDFDGYVDSLRNRGGSCIPGGDCCR